VSFLLAARRVNSDADAGLGARDLNLVQQRQGAHQVTGPDGVRRERGELCYRATVKPGERRQDPV
jgi:hypothetical protein